MSPPRQAHARARAAINYPTYSINANDRDTAHQNDFSLNAAGVNPNHLIHPNADGVNIELQAAVQTMIDINTPENTRQVRSKNFLNSATTGMSLHTNLTRDTLPLTKHTGLCYI
jgi:hypothetical protein